MDKRSPPNANRKPPSQNYSPRRDYGDMTEDEALEAHREGKSRMAWDAESINVLYNPNLRKRP